MNDHDTPITRLVMAVLAAAFMALVVAWLLDQPEPITERVVVVRTTTDGTPAGR